MALELNINGEKQTVNVSPDTPLLWAIRDEIGLTGTKYGCGVASCGSCTVHVDGEPVRSCSTNAGDVVDSEIVTIEGIKGPAAEAVQSSWEEQNVVQCGYCQSGQIMSAVGLLSQNPNPTDQEIDEYMSGNACRCATYQRIRAAIHSAADKMEG